MAYQFDCWMNRLTSSSIVQLAFMGEGRGIVQFAWMGVRRPWNCPTNLRGRAKTTASSNSLAWAAEDRGIVQLTFMGCTCFNMPGCILCNILYIICVLYCMYDQEHTVLFLLVVYFLYFKELYLPYLMYRVFANIFYVLFYLKLSIFFL